MAAIDLTSANTNKSTQMAKLLNSDGGYHLLAPQDIGAHVRVIPFNYVADEAKAANELIVLGFLGRGMKVLDLKVYCDGAVATADLDVGLVPKSTLDDAAINGLMNDADIATAGVYSITPASILTEVTEDSYLVGKLQTAGLANADVIKGYALVFENI